MTKRKQPLRECIQCNRLKPLNTGFYISKAMTAVEGRMNICKSCVSDMINEEDITTVKNTLRELNVPFLEKYWKSAVKSKTATVGTYLRQVNSLAQTANLSYEDSDDTKYIKDFVIEEEEEEEDEFVVTRKIIKFWGSGFVKDEYEYLDEMYQDYTAVYEVSTPTQKNIYKNICKSSLQADKAISTGDISTYEKLMRTIGSLSEQAKIQPKQDNGFDEDATVLGMWIEKIEKTEPLTETAEEFRDVDGIEKYINKWFIKPMRKVLGVD